MVVVMLILLVHLLLLWIEMKNKMFYRQDNTDAVSKKLQLNVKVLLKNLDIKIE